MNLILRSSTSALTSAAVFGVSGCSAIPAGP
jgi:hypothetical protein